MKTLVAFVALFTASALVVPTVSQAAPAAPSATLQ